MSRYVQEGADRDMKIGIQGRRKHLKLGGGARHFEGTFSLRKKRYFLKMKGLFFVCRKILGASAPSAPGSYVYVGIEALRNS